MVVKDDHNFFWITIIIILLLGIVGAVIFFNFDKIKSLYEEKLDVNPNITISYLNNEEIEPQTNVSDDQAQISTDYLEFSINGQYNAGGIIPYHIYINNKKLDNNLKFYLTEVINEEETLIESDKYLYLNSYSELDNLKVLYSNNFDFNKNVTYNKTYRLRVWTNDNVDKQEKININISTKKLMDLNECFIISDMAITGYKCYRGNEYDMPVVTNIVIPNKIAEHQIQEIKENAFYDIKKEQGYGLKSVIIKNGITIGNSAFKDNEIETLYLPEDLTILNDEIFADNRITELLIPDKVVSIGTNSFSNNVLITLDIPSTVTRIKSNAFANNSLTEITIHGKTSIEEFSEFDYSSFGFMIGYSAKNISFVE